MLMLNNNLNSITLPYLLRSSRKD